MDWRNYVVSVDGTHHVHAGLPAYDAQFHEVLKFHAPGLAPVRDASGAYHITPEGLPAYRERYLRTFGFYEGKSAVSGGDGLCSATPESQWV